MKAKEGGLCSGWDWLSQAGCSKEQLGNMSSGIPVTRFDPDVHTACTPRLWVTWDMISKDSDEDMIRTLAVLDVICPSLLSSPPLHTTQWP